ncbi:MAG: hypothetical protein IPO63_10185 [Bacteroidetes bacterium]|nr:hypothetical protein [Bacteroidota bacterium]
MESIKQKTCPTCGQKAHNFEREEFNDCVPPIDVLKFGQYIINSEYRKTLFKGYPLYTAEEIVGSFLGHNNNFPSQDDWYEEQNENSDVE